MKTTLKLRTPLLTILALMLALPSLSAPLQPAPHVTIRQATVAAPHPVLVVYVKDFVDSSGTDHPQAVLFPALISIDQIGQAVGIQYDAWASPAAVQAEFAGKQLTPVGQHSYTITKAQFPAIAMQTVSGSLGGAIFAVCAQAAMTTQDVPQTNADGTPKLGTDGKPVMQSWVVGAQMETLDLVTGTLTPYTGG